jgi:hypothetical protein
VREDPKVRGLLYAGTEFGLYVSFDDGGHWQNMQLNLPPIPITDMRVHRDDLVISTQGRGIYILDDVTPLHWAREAHAALASGSAPAHLFPPRDTVQAFASGGSGPEARRGENPPDGVQIFYALEADFAARATAAVAAVDSDAAEADRADTEGAENERHALTLEIFSPDGDLIRTFYSNRDPDPNPTDIDFAPRGQIRLTTDAGMNRFAWNMRYAPTDRPDGLVIYGLTHGPRTIPGEHRARLSVGDWSREVSFRIVADPRVDTPQVHHEERLEMGLRMRADLQAVFDAMSTLWSVRDQIRDRVDRMRAAGIDVAEIEVSAKSIIERLDELELLLWQPKIEGYDDIENFVPGIDNRIAYLYSKVDGPNHRPTTGQRLRYEELHAEVEELLAELDSLYATDVADLNRMMSDSGAVIVQIPGRQR